MNIRTLSYKMPPGRVQWVSCSPGDVSSICLTSVILELESRAELSLRIQRRIIVDVTLPAARNL